LQFLRHIERTRALAFLIPIDAIDWQTEYDQLRREIESYSEELARKPHCVVFTKMDLLGEDDAPPIDAPDAFGVFAISAAGRTGLDPLLGAWWSQLLGMKKASVKRDESIQLP
jgi:GTP-binding protein